MVGKKASGGFGASAAWAGLAIGACAAGAMAIGALAIGRLTIRGAKISHLEIDELTVRTIALADRSAISRALPELDLQRRNDPRKDWVSFVLPAIAGGIAVIGGALVARMAQSRLEHIRTPP